MIGHLARIVAIIGCLTATFGVAFAQDKCTAFCAKRCSGQSGTTIQHCKSHCEAICRARK